MKATRKDSAPNPASLRSALVVAILLVAGHANAQWKVTDEVTHEGLDRLDETLKTETNKRLEEVRNQQKIDGATKSADKDPDAPKEALQEARPTAVTVDGTQARCGTGGRSAAATNQMTICKEIINTELAQYNYALAMRKVALDRQKRLNDVESARAKLGENDAGKLQSNSNQLLALLARMESDRQQYRTYMDAYAARLTYLRALHGALGNRAMNSTDAVAGAAAGFVGLETLKRMLDAEQSEKRGRP